MKIGAAALADTPPRVLFDGPRRDQSIWFGLLSSSPMHAAGHTSIRGQDRTGRFFAALISTAAMLFLNYSGI